MCSAARFANTIGFPARGKKAVSSATLIEELKAAKFGSDKEELLKHAADLIIVNSFESVKQLANNDFDTHWKKRLSEDDSAKCTAGMAALTKQLISRQTKLMELSMNQESRLQVHGTDDISEASNMAAIGDAMTKVLDKQKKGKHHIHIDLQSKIAQLSMADIGHDLWPKSESVNHLANQKALLQDQNVKVPFVHAKLKYFLPIWMLEKPSDSEMLHVNLWSPAYIRYAIAADAIDMVRIDVAQFSFCYIFLHPGSLVAVNAAP